MAGPSNKNLNYANQAEILRSYQRDNDFISKMSETITDLLHRYNLFRKFSGFIKSDTSAKLLYFLVTSGLGNQTLGEEYTGIVQANLDKKQVPSIMLRILSALIECFGEIILIKLLEKLQNLINKQDSNLTPQAKLFLNTLISRLRIIIPVLIMVHRGLFYIFGRHYSIGRRLTGIDYIKVYGPRPHSTIGWGLRILGFATIVQSLFRLWQSKSLIEEIVNDDKEIGGNSISQCQLCFEKVPDTATLCGHLFCWTCLAECLRTRNRCPICRENVVPSRIVPLMNL